MGWGLGLGLGLDNLMKTTLVNKFICIHSHEKKIRKNSVIKYFSRFTKEEEICI